MTITVNEAAAVLRAAVRNTIRQRSLLFLIQGAGLALAGALAIVFPAFGSSGIAVLVGWLLILAGLLQALSLIGVTAVPYFWLDLGAIVLSILVGWLLISRPDVGLTEMTFLLLVLFVVGGIQKISSALMIRPMADWGWILLSGVVAILCAMLLFQTLPEAPGWMLGLLLGLYLIAIGGAQAWMTWNLRRAEDEL